MPNFSLMFSRFRLLFHEVAAKWHPRAINGLQIRKNNGKATKRHAAKDRNSI